MAAKIEFKCIELGGLISSSSSKHNQKNNKGEMCYNTFVGNKNPVRVTTGGCTHDGSSSLDKYKEKVTAVTFLSVPLVMIWLMSGW